MYQIASNLLASTFSTLLFDEKNAYIVHSGKLRDNLVGVSLIHKETLPSSRIIHFHGILGHQCVEECIVLFGNRTCKLSMYFAIHFTCEQ